jgi:hypothetical protein
MDLLQSFASGAHRNVEAVVQGIEVRQALDAFTTNAGSTSDLCQAMDRLEAAHAQVAREVRHVLAFAGTQLRLKVGPDDHTADNCPTYYDGCHCTVETLVHNIKRAEEAERELELMRGRQAAERRDNR